MLTPEQELPTVTEPRPLNLEEIDGQVLRLFALVGEGLAAATESFLAGDREAARKVAAGDVLIDDLQLSIEEWVQLDLARSASRSERIPLLVSILRIVPELERSGDLVEHIALRTQPGLVTRITPLARGLIGEMGRLGVEMWSRAADAWCTRDASAVIGLRRLDDQLDDLHVRLTAELAESTTSMAAAIEMGLVARFYERLGDHAVNVARRIDYLASGGRPGT